MAIAGRVAIVPKGEWSTTENYDRLDEVRYNNHTFVAKKASVGVAPVDGEYWMLSSVGLDQAQFDELNSNLNSEISRAKETEETLKSRIDTITSLPEGSTTGDAELQDIRVKADGTIAENAGNAVREQFSELKGDLTKKIYKPSIVDNGKTPRAKDGNVEWVEQGLPSDEQTATAVQNWLNEHPEATTTVQDGSINEYKFTNELKKKKANYYTSVEKMKEDVSLVVGSVCVTLGYYEPNDGGGSIYTVRNKKISDIDDGGSIHILATGDIVAEMIIGDCVTPKMFGAKGDGIADDTQTIQDALSYCAANRCNLLFSSGKYIVKRQINVPDMVSILGFNVSHTGLEVSEIENKILSTIKYTGSGEESVINFEGVGGIRDILIDGNSYWINEHSAPTSENVYFDKRTEEIWIPNVNGVTFSGNSSKNEIHNVMAFRCSGYGIMIPGYNMSDNLHSKCCKIGLSINKVDSVTVNFLVQSCNTGVYISTNGATISNGRVEECIKGVIADNGVDISINLIKFDQMSMCGIEIVRGSLRANGITIDRSGQNLCTFKSIDNVPSNYKEQTCGILISNSPKRSFYLSNVDIIKSVYDDNVESTNMCPLIPVVSTTQDYFDGQLELFTVGFYEYNRALKDFSNAVLFLTDVSCNLLFTVNGVHTRRNFNGTTITDKYNFDDTQVSTVPIELGEIRTVGKDIVIGLGGSTDDWHVLGQLSDTDITSVTPALNVTNEVTIEHGKLTCDRIKGRYTFTSNSVAGWSYTVFTVNSDRKLSGGGVLIDNSNNTVKGYIHYDLAKIGGGQCDVKTGNYNIEEGKSYTIILF